MTVQLPQKNALFVYFPHWLALAFNPSTPQHIFLSAFGLKSIIMVTGPHCVSAGWEQRTPQKQFHQSTVPQLELFGLWVILYNVWLCTNNQCFGFKSGIWGLVTTYLYFTDALHTVHGQIMICIHRHVMFLILSYVSRSLLPHWQSSGTASEHANNVPWLFYCCVKCATCCTGAPSLCDRNLSGWGLYLGPRGAHVDSRLVHGNAWSGGGTYCWVWCKTFMQILKFPIRCLCKCIVHKNITILEYTWINITILYSHLVNHFLPDSVLQILWNKQFFISLYRAPLTPDEQGNTLNRIIM